MREIKFRAKMIDSPEEWVYGSLVYNCDDECYIVEHCDEELSFPVITDTVGQFTGLKDAEGIDIYEGDIVEVIVFDQDGNDYERTGVVKCLDGCFGADFERKEFFYPFLDFDTEEYIVVMGSICDNSELLKGSEE